MATSGSPSGLFRPEMMRILIVEDEAMVAARLERLIRGYFGDREHSLTVADSLTSARDELVSETPDVVFLDLNLNGRDGFELLNEAVAGPFHTIVVSAHHTQALRAFELGVLDFVPKPFGPARLEQALRRVEQRRSEARPDTERVELEHLAVKKTGRIELVPVAAVRTIQGSGDYSTLHLDDGSTRLHSKTLNTLEQILPARFARVHRSYLVDLRRVIELHAASGGRYWLELDGGARVPVSRSRIEEVRGLLLD